MTVVSLTQKEPPMPPLAADPAPVTTYREPTRDERMTIHDELTKAYDIVGHRYSGNGSDAALAARLSMPRKWVADLRSMFFGDHDRNETVEKKAKELDAAIVLAQTASTRLMEMALEAETLHQDLVVARKKLDA